MKTRIFKTILPAFAILLAISLSFAAEANRTTQIGYYDDPLIPGIQQVTTSCDPNATGSLCDYEGFQLYDEMALETPLKRVSQ